MASKEAITKALLRLDSVFMGQKPDPKMEIVRLREYTRILQHCRDQDLEAAVDTVIENYRPGENGAPWFPAPAVIAGHVRDAARARVNRGDLSVVQISDERYRAQVDRDRFDKAMADAPEWLREKMVFWKEKTGM